MGRGAGLGEIPGDDNLISVEPPERFGTTLWGRLAEARSHDPSSLAPFSSAYREPVVHLARRSGRGQEESERAAGEVFLRLLAPPILEAADRHRSRLRLLLLSVSRQVLTDPHSLAAVETVERLVRSTPAPDAEFDLEWFGNLARLARGEGRARVLRSARDRIAFYASSVEEYEEDVAALRGFFERLR